MATFTLFSTGYAGTISPCQMMSFDLMNTHEVFHSVVHDRYTLYDLAKVISGSISPPSAAFIALR
jgi:hypothetical protein